jgi:hypothetical protein
VSLQGQPPARMRLAEFDREARVEGAFRAVHGLKKPGR